MNNRANVFEREQGNTFEALGKRCLPLGEQKRLMSQQRAPEKRNLRDFQ